MAHMEPGFAPLRLSLWRRLWGVLVAPRTTFEDIVTRGGFWPGAAVVYLAGLLAALSTLPKLRAFALWQLQQGPNALPPEQLAAVRGFATTAALVELFFGALIVPTVVWLFGAGLLKIFNRSSGEPVPFASLAAVSVFAYVPMLLGDFVRAALIAASSFERLGSIGTSLGALLPGRTEIAWLDLVLAQVDPFALWALGLFSLGGALALRTRTSNIALVVFSLWGLWVVVGVFLGLRSPSA
ncbi:MAG: YIP1 family protein [Thermoanaerobacterales bacterium]|nr:YIP1 family protein [Thermoanaerobacterales bacterium]